MISRTQAASQGSPGGVGGGCCVISEIKTKLDLTSESPRFGNK